MPFDAAADLGADWLELKAISAPDGKLILTDVERIWELNRASENEDPLGATAEFDDWLNERLVYVQRRMQTLGTAYPFALERGDRELVFAPDYEAQDGHVIYLLCLVLSTANESEVFADGLPITPEMRDAFQACSAWAAAGAIHGSAYCFGWPRSDGSDFLDALSHVYTVLMADGEVRPRGTAPAGASGREKDAGVDVIAWRERLDVCAGKVHLLGQVASGKNWQDKPVHSAVEALRLNWISQPWVVQPMLAMFIPFSIRPVGDVSHQQQIRYLSGTHGVMFYREVLPRYAAAGLALARELNTYCHRRREIRKLRAAANKWRPSFIASQ